jgi:beta-glucuronidase
VLPSFVRVGLAIGLAAIAAAATAAPAAAAPVFTPPEGAVTYDGATGRFLMNGAWLLRRDPHDKGIGARWFQSRSAKGWSAVSVPNAWNAGTFTAASMAGGVAWYRREFRLPSSASRYNWLARFESTRYRATVWLNGTRVGGHEGGYLPFEVNLAKGLSRAGVNRIVVRVDNRQRNTDLPTGSLTVDGKPNGGWWNYGGLLGDVYLRRVDGIDVPIVQVLPRLPCRTCDARIDYRVTVQSYGAATPVTVTSRFGDQDVALGTELVGAGKRLTFRKSVTVASPHLWSPPDPYLYPVSIAADGVAVHAGWTLESGIRSLGVVKGRLLLNWLPVNFRGGFFHEDSPAKGGAADPARMRLVIDRLKQVGGTVLRTHYPLDPYFHQLADRRGVMLWSEIPVFQTRSKLLKQPVVQNAARQMLRENILDKSNHPSVLAWSIGNELSSRPSSVQRSYFKSQAALIHALDPTRPAALAILGYPHTPCTSAYTPLDLLGVNTYFGWYPGPNGSIADRTNLAPYLKELRSCYRKKAIAVTEFGAEANRHGPRNERGTYEFQADWDNYTLSVFAKTPWLSGAVGMLMNFHARPVWAGGNPKPSPMGMHAKGIFDFQGNPKPAAAVVSAWYHKTQQYDLPGP